MAGGRGRVVAGGGGVSRDVEVCDGAEVSGGEHDRGAVWRTWEVARGDGAGVVGGSGGGRVLDGGEVCGGRGGVVVGVGVRAVGVVGGRGSDGAEVVLVHCER